MLKIGFASARGDSAGELDGAAASAVFLERAGDGAGFEVLNGATDVYLLACGDVHDDWESEAALAVAAEGFLACSGACVGLACAGDYVLDREDGEFFGIGIFGD